MKVQQTPMIMGPLLSVILAATDAKRQRPMQPFGKRRRGGNDQKIKKKAGRYEAYDMPSTGLLGDENGYEY